MHAIIDPILTDLFGDASGSGLVTIKDLQEKHGSISGEGHDDGCNLLVQKIRRCIETARLCRTVRGEGVSTSGKGL
jgi:hypothetical protein